MGEILFLVKVGGGRGFLEEFEYSIYGSLFVIGWRCMGGKGI